MIVNSRAVVVPLIALLLAWTAPATSADEPALRLTASVTAAEAAPLTIELLRWSTDAERAPLLAALTAPPPAAARGDAAPAAARQGGRGGRGGRGPAAPLSPAARLSAAVKAAPTVGFIWGDGPTGYAIKYAWRDTTSGAPGRVVLVTDRRIGAHWPSWPQATAAAPDAEFTLLEMRLNSSGAGEGKASLTAGTVVDAAAQTLALDGYAAAPVLLRVTP